MTAPDPRDIVSWLERLGISEGDRVLDVGCGRGRFASAAAEIVGRRGLVLAADVDRHKLAEFGRSTGRRLLVVLADGRELPAPTGVFDAAILGFVLHEVDEPYPLLNEVRRTLREDGRLLVFEWKPDVPVKSAGARRLASGDVGRLFDSAGFRVDEIAKVNDSVYAVRGSMAKVLCCGAYSPVLM